jgi:hypothetical protein
MIMKFQLPFTPPGWRPDPSISPFEFTGTGVDSLGTFTIENTSLDLWRSTVYFDKVYHRSASKGGVLRHLYAGLVTPFGMGGCFNTEDEDDPLGYWFIGRPIACLDSSLHAAKKAVGSIVICDRSKNCSEYFVANQQNSQCWDS